jgi:3-oxoacyl-[acyl-carrier protein] reductase
LLPLPGTTFAHCSNREQPLLERLRHVDAIERFGRPDEVAAMVVFLASPRASYVHGTDVHVDGGDAGTMTR